jgi:hypothetical protein
MSATVAIGDVIIDKKPSDKAIAVAITASPTPEIASVTAVT